MDNDFLVRSGSTLLRLLDDGGLKPRVAMWVYNSDTDSWRLWIVPAAGMTDKAEFYLRLARIISDHRNDLPGFDIGSVEFKTDRDQVVIGMTSVMRITGISSVRISNTQLNGVYLPDGIVLRMAV